MIIGTASHNQHTVGSERAIEWKNVTIERARTSTCSPQRDTCNTRSKELVVASAGTAGAASAARAVVRRIERARVVVEVYAELRE